MGRPPGEWRFVEPPRCPAGDDIIGVYEPLVHLRDGFAMRTSRAAEPEICSGGKCFSPRVLPAAGGRGLARRIVRTVATVGSYPASGSPCAYLVGAELGEPPLGLAPAEACGPGAEVHEQRVDPPLRIHVRSTHTAPPLLPRAAALVGITWGIRRWQAWSMSPD